MTQKCIVIAVVGVLVFLSHASEHNVKNIITANDLEKVCIEISDAKWENDIEKNAELESLLDMKVNKQLFEASGLMRRAYHGMGTVISHMRRSSPNVMQTGAILSLNITATGLKKIRNENQKELSEASQKELSNIIEKIEMMTQNKIVSAIIPKQNFSTEQLIEDYALDDFICPDTFPVFCNFQGIYGCFADTINGEFRFATNKDCERMKYTMDIELFYLLSESNNYINEENINNYKGEYLEIVTRYEYEPLSTNYIKVPKLEFDVSKFMKKDVITNMKKKRVTQRLQIVSIELKERGPPWIQKHCGMCTIFLFFAIIFCRHYVYEKIKMKCIHDGHEKHDDDGNDDDKNDDDDINTDENYHDDGKTEVVASEI